MSGISKKLMGTTAAGGEFLAIEDVFSTYLYTGNGSTQTITNEIDLATEGGLVWIKDRVGAFSHNLADTERGANNYLFTDSTQAQFDAGTARISSFNSDGFSLGSGSNGTNASGNGHASWTFRKAPRFFDVVTWTGDGTAGRSISHSLGVQPGFIAIKATSSVTSGNGSWVVAARKSDGSYAVGDGTAAQSLYGFGLNLSNQSYDTVSSANANTFLTDASFAIQYVTGNNGSFQLGNAYGVTYVAYLFAHDPLGPSEDGSDGFIACGSYTGNNSADGPVVDLGWEPQWLLIKESSASGNAWSLYDTMRNGTMDQHLRPNASDAEAIAAASPEVLPQATGFKLNTSSGRVNRSQTYIYIAIRRGPMRAPESGTEVFAVSQPANTARATTIPFFEAGFAPDAAIDRFNKNGTFGERFSSRLTGPVYLFTNATDAEASNAYHDYNTYMDGYYTNLGTAQGGDDVAWMFRRAPGFFDAVAYTGDGAYPTARAVPHNLGVAPELVIYKCRSASVEWEVHLNVTGSSYLRAYLNYAFAAAGSGSTLPYGAYAAAPDESNVYIRDAGGNTVNGAGQTYIAYLFATLPGISKVGSYTGNSGTQTIDCGFTTGARFVMVKAASTSGAWFVWDTARGIVSGTEPYLRLNSSVAEENGYDAIDPDSSGFTLNNVGTGTNDSGTTYIFLAIA